MKEEKAKGSPERLLLLSLLLSLLVSLLLEALLSLLTLAKPVLALLSLLLVSLLKPSVALLSLSLLLLVASVSPLLSFAHSKGPCPNSLIEGGACMSCTDCVLFNTPPCEPASCASDTAGV